MHSFQTAIFSLNEYSKFNFSRKNPVLCKFHDIAKAFDAHNGNFAALHNRQHIAEWTRQKPVSSGSTVLIFYYRKYDDLIRLLNLLFKLILAVARQMKTRQIIQIIDDLFSALCINSFVLLP